MHKDIQVTETLPAYHSYPDSAEQGSKHPGLILIHEIWGLQPHIKDVADRFAKEGYSVLAPDLFADVHFESHVDQTILGEMQNPETRDTAQQKMRAATVPIRTPEFAKIALEKLQKCFEYLEHHEHINGKIGVLGFCFGGTYSFALATVQAKLACAVPFYGQGPALEKIPQIQCPIVAVYGELDAPLMESLPALKEEMSKQNKQFEALVYKEARHAFFNDTNPATYNETAAQDVWPKVLSFLEKNLKN